jgi:hypothetical protein
MRVSKQTGNYQRGAGDQLQDAAGPCVSCCISAVNTIGCKSSINMVAATPVS